MFPNPASDRLTVRLASNAQSIRLIDVTGREVRVQENSGPTRQFTFDITDLASGFYSVVVVTDSGLLTQQWIKQ